MQAAGIGMAQAETQRRNPDEERFLVLAPNGRDARRIHEVLVAADVPALTCPDPEALLQGLREGAAAAIIAQEALPRAALTEIAEWQSSQPIWSDMPFLVLRCGARPNPDLVVQARDLERLGTVILLDRPLHNDTLRTSLRVALRSRKRQYEARTHREYLTRAQRDLEQFAYSASHDLREPLRTVAIFSEMLSTRYSSALDDQGLLFLDYLKSAAGRMEMLVRDLLAYTQAIGFEDALAEPVEALDQLENALVGLRETLRSSSATVTHEPLPSVRMKPVHLQALFQQLIGNAIKFRSQRRPPEEQPRMHITAVPENEYWRFSVADNGIGIEPQFQKQIFGIFQRLHPDDKFPGTGIGLAICQKIVERYGGRIWVESELGKGSTFHFTVPACSLQNR